MTVLNKAAEAHQSNLLLYKEIRHIVYATEYQATDDCLK